MASVIFYCMVAFQIESEGWQNILKLLMKTWQFNLKPNLSEKYDLFRTLLFKPVVLWSNARPVSPREWPGKHCYMMLALHSSAKQISMYSKWEWERCTSPHEFICLLIFQQQKGEHMELFEQKSIRVILNAMKMAFEWVYVTRSPKINSELRGLKA